MDADIPVDLFNPGQVFACLGFLEAADILLGDAEGGFDWSDEGNVRFRLRAAGEENPVAAVLDFLAGAEVEAQSPRGSGQLDQWGAATRVDPDGVFPVTPKVKEKNVRIWIKESALPISLSVLGHPSLHVSHWADIGNGREPLKTWGGASGKSGASRMRDLLQASGTLFRGDSSAVVLDPFNSAHETGGFRLEMRRDYVPMDIGFSVNRHQSTMSARGYPIVEALGPIGLENSRPQVLDRLNYRYGVWSEVLGMPLARAAIGCANVSISLRTFAATLGEPNEYDRSILFAIEELQPCPL